MAKPKGSPKTGGRVAGTPNKATSDIKALARAYTERAMIELARIATQGESESARVAAIKELFDRGYGKATQLIGGDEDNPLVIVNKEARDAAVAAATRADL